MRTIICALGLLGTAACSGGDAPEEPGNFTCAPGDVVGTYSVQYEQLSGDCSALPDGPLEIDADDTPDAGCAYEMAPTFSDDGCESSAIVTCIEEGLATTVGGTTRQEAADGSRISGQLEVTVRDAASGDFICQGTYRITGTR
ncbi:MAG TPA: hypothetical protein VKZ49_10810 [Polyangiaceae bacterium]|nr:hypothetical protein [Polyangiaceae bacterium]